MIFISEEDDLRMIEEHNQKSVEELVENFAYVYVYLADGRSYTLTKESKFEFKDGKFHIYDKDIEVDIVDIELIEFLIEKGDLDALKEIVKGPKLNFDIHKKMIENGTIDHKYVEENHLSWQYICDFFATIDDKIKKLEEEKK